MEFKKYKLEEICSLYQPQTISGKEILSRGKFLVYGANGIIGYYDSYNHEDCEIAMTCRGATCGNIIWTKPRSWITGNAMVVHPTSSVVDKRYLYYFLKEKKMSRAITGSAQPQITRSDLEFFEVLLPPLEEQKKIAGTLALIDRKIELCEAQNRTLEKLARQIYDYWFVQFDFPDENGKPYKSSGGKMVYNEKLKREIPEGWEVKNVGMLCSIVTGKEDANFSTPDGQYPFFTCSNSVLRCDKADFEGNAILLSGNGDFSVKHFRGKFNAYQRTYVLSPYEEKHYAVTYLGTEMAIRGFKKQSSGSIIKFITKGDVEKIPLFDEPFLDEIYVLLNELLFKIEESTAQIQTLTSLRERLLPLLMSGQVEVRD